MSREGRRGLKQNVEDVKPDHLSLPWHMDVYSHLRWHSSSIAPGSRQGYRRDLTVAQALLGPGTELLLSCSRHHIAKPVDTSHRDNCSGLNQ